MNPIVSERAFEEAIEAALLRYGPDEIPGQPTGVAEEPAPFGDPWMQPGGYHRRQPEDYDRELSLLPERRRWTSFWRRSQRNGRSCLSTTARG